MRTSPRSMPSRRDDRWSIPLSQRCRRTPGSSFPGIRRCPSSRPSATARRELILVAGPSEKSKFRAARNEGNELTFHMPLQNRVTPTGEIIASPHRGMFTGNRGIIHDPATKTLLRKRWASPAWLTCVCEFRGRRREVMGGRSWTELFFLDEATAFAAGHRPCFFCRREAANRFRAAWQEGNRPAARLRASEIDVALHWERLAE